ncbi:hypothetical protein COJ85_07435 [Bacillus sp. AFS076308]|uniref:Ger(x)C family spore germination C-terminal domain-containing protein n=1 Tax=unclassified Bacillus (in: firmicutes) TaxID=185979 RepID=UPI000BF43CFB|nr:hypothetical protein COJ85_07435 [Bacillus sp. AFS076308]PGV52727.1 hypothetical protein COD92_08490 [Bacillus sp. AFS037270]
MFAFSFVIHQSHFLFILPRLDTNQPIQLKIGYGFIHNINMKQSFILKLLMERFKNGNYKNKLTVNDKEDSLLLKNLDSKVTYTVEKSKPIPHILIDLKLNAQIKYELSLLKLSKKNNHQKSY